MKLRNRRVAKMTGTKALAGLLVLGLTFGTPMAVFADDVQVMSETIDSIYYNEDGKLQAKSVDGRDTMTEVSDEVLGMIDKEEVKLNQDTGYLEDTQTGQKVDPVTGDRVDVIPANPDTPSTPDTPEQPDTPSVPDTPSTPDVPSDSTPSDSTADNNTGDTGTGTVETPAEQVPENSQELAAAEAADAANPDAASTNAELIAKQQIVSLPQYEEDFRFWTVARKYAFAKQKISIREAVPADISGYAETDLTESDLQAAQKDADKLFKTSTKSKKKTSAKKTTEHKLTKEVDFAAMHIPTASFFTKVTEKTEESQETASASSEQTTQTENISADLALTAQLLEEKVRSVGELSQDGLLYILKEEENGWLYVESGNVRGFVKASEVYTGDSAQILLSGYQKKAEKAAKKAGTEYTGIEGTAQTAKESVPSTENQAFTYVRATAQKTLADKNYALVNEQVGTGTLDIKESQDDNARTIGTMVQGNLCYILADQDAEWVYVESGDVRGFVRKEYLNTGDEVKAQVEAAGAAAFATAAEVVAPEENQALYYTLSSVEPGKPGNAIRQSMLEYAAQFIGNPYVWGGTSLTNGADCSGFVQQIYKAFGYNLPRVAADQSQYGTQIPLEDAQPGDLIFYAKNGHVYHVVMYAGNGETIEAANEDVGIIHGSVYQQDAVWATRILDESYDLTGTDVNSVNTAAENYGDSIGAYKITYYCSCESCRSEASKVSATGTPIVEGQTIAVDPNVIPYGTKVIIDGHEFTAQDYKEPGAENEIRVYVNDHNTAQMLGEKYSEVFLEK